MPLYRILATSTPQIGSVHFVSARNLLEAKKLVETRPEENYVSTDIDWRGSTPLIDACEIVQDGHCAEGVAEGFCEICGDPICLKCAGKRPHDQDCPDTPVKVAKARCPACKKHWISSAQADPATVSCLSCNHVGLLIELEGGHV